MTAESALKIAPYQRAVNLLEIAERRQSSGPGDVAVEGSFKEMFSRELASEKRVNISKHASQRLFSRGIELSDESLGKIAEAIDKAGVKGSKDTLILTDKAALVVSVPHRTIVTAFDREKLREGIVTQIDSAIIV